jgi:hypothetical protein
MVHKTKNIQYDEYGDALNLTEEEKKWNQYKKYFRHTPVKLLEQVFDSLWKETGGNFDAGDFEHAMMPVLKKYEDEKHVQSMKDFEKANFTAIKH